jgi:hypothetical protein
MCPLTDERLLDLGDSFQFLANAESKWGDHWVSVPGRAGLSFTVWVRITGKAKKLGGMA